MPANNVDVIFTDGIRQDSDPRAMPPNALRQARNCIVEADGAIEKRPGSDSLGLTVTFNSAGLVTTSTITTIKRLASYSAELLVFVNTDGGGGAPPAPLVTSEIVTRDTNGSTFSHVDYVSPFLASRADIVEWAGEFSGGYDVAYTAGLTVFAYSPNGVATSNVTNVYATVIDNDTGAKLIDGQLINATQNVAYPRVLIAGNTAIVAYSQANVAGSVFMSKMDLNNVFVGFSGEQAVSTCASPRPIWDACEISGDTGNVVVVSATAITTPNVQVRKVDTSSILPVDTTFFTHPSGTCVGLGAHATAGERAWVVFSTEEATGNSNTRVRTYTLTPLTAELGATDVAATINATIGEPVKVSVTRGDVATKAMVTASGPRLGGTVESKASTVTTAAVVVSGWNVKNYQFVSRSAYKNNTAYIVAQGMQFFSLPGSSLGYYDTAYHLVDLNYNAVGGRVPWQVARVAPRITQQTTTAFRPSNLYQLSGDTKFLALGSIKKTATTQGRTGMTLMTFDGNAALQYQTVQLGDLLYIAGGVPSHYDGSRVAEINYEFSPGAGTAIGSSGGAIANGTYRYALLWEWFDSKGAVHRSAPSFSSNVVVTVGPNANVTLTSNGIALTKKVTFGSTLTAPYLVPYRTLELTANPGSQFYRVIGDAPSANILTGPPGTAITYLDTQSDANIATHPTIYTTGGVLENQSPSASSVVTVHKNRIWMVGDDDTTLWFSKESTPGEAPGFNDILTYPFPEGGKIYGLASLDDKLLVLKRYGLFVIAGDGPSDTGTGYDYSRPFQVLTDVGCDNWRSVVATPKGVFFADSRKGIFLCSRNLEVDWIGHKVDDLFTAYPVVTSAVLHRNRRWVLFTCKATEADTFENGITLVYDLEHDKWTSWDYMVSEGERRPVVSATNFNGIYTVALGYPDILRGNTSIFRDNAENIVFVVEMGHQLNGVSGDMIVRRAWLQGETMGPHGLSVEFARNFSNTYDPAINVTEAQVANMSLERIRFGPKYKRCQAFTMKITEIPTTNANATGQGVRLHGITYEAVPLQGPYPRVGGGQKA